MTKCSRKVTIAGKGPRARDLPRKTTAAFILPGPRDGAASGAECPTPRASSDDGII